MLEKFKVATIQFSFKNRGIQGKGGLFRPEIFAGSKIFRGGDYSDGGIISTFTVIRLRQRVYDLKHINKFLDKELDNDKKKIEARKKAWAMLDPIFERLWD